MTGDVVYVTSTVIRTSVFYPHIRT